jgi:hypothetical protein
MPLPAATEQQPFKLHNQRLIRRDGPVRHVNPREVWVDGELEPPLLLDEPVGGMTPGRVKRLERYKNYG